MGYYKRIIVFDFETGGKDPTVHAVTEIAMVAIDADTLQTVAEYSALIRPYGLEYTEEAAKVSNISLELLEKEGRELNEVFEEMLDFFADNKIGNRKPILAGHNIDNFDMGFMQQLFDLCKRKMDRDIDTSITIDTLKFSRLTFIDTAVHTLGAACANVNVALKESHRALPDTKANAELVVKLISSLRGNGQSGSGIEKKRVSYLF